MNQFCCAFSINHTVTCCYIDEAVSCVSLFEEVELCSWGKVAIQKQLQQFGCRLPTLQQLITDACLSPNVLLHVSVHGAWRLKQNSANCWTTWKMDTHSWASNLLKLQKIHFIIHMCLLPFTESLHQFLPKKESVQFINICSAFAFRKCVRVCACVLH